MLFSFLGVYQMAVEGGVGEWWWRDEDTKGEIWRSGTRLIKNA